MSTSVILNDSQINWINDKINREKASASSSFESETHTIDEARAAIEYYDFLNELNSTLLNGSKIINESPQGTFTKVKPQEINLAESKPKRGAKKEEFKVPEDKVSTEDIGAPVIPEINSTKSTEEELSVISSAQEQMNEAKEKELEDIFDL